MPDDGQPNRGEVFAGDETPSGTTAFLEALMAMLGEVLGRVDRRLSSLEATLKAPSGQGPDPQGEDASDMVAVALERVSERLERLEARDPAAIPAERALARLEDLSGSVEEIGQRVAGLTDLMAAKSEAEEEWPEGLQASLAALGEGVAVIGAQVKAQGSEIVLARDEGMTRVVGALERISERLERLEDREPTAIPPERALARLDDLTGSVEDIGRRLTELSDLLTLSSEAEEEWPEGLHDSLTDLGEGIADIRAQVTAQASQSTASRLDDLSAAVDSIGYGLAGITDLMAASTSQSEEWPQELRAGLLDLSEGIGELREDLQTQPVADLRGSVTNLEAQLARLTDQLAAQPAPGAAVAMVAAGLAERFEERTQALTELLEAHAAYVRLTWERIEGMLDGGAFDELAVGEALEHVIDNQESMADSMEGVVRRLEGLQAAPQAAPQTAPEAAPDHLPREMLETLAAGMESVVARVDDVRRRLVELDRSLAESSPEGGTSPEAPEPASLLGRRASTAGRRLATDLGRRGRGRPSRPPESGQSEPRR
ncbi:MAG: hypothetical protein M3N28_06820 [Actinomycetota bacterium]|nr:hypothetical protein [Actinomycetota bacterium]